MSRGMLLVAGLLLAAPLAAQPPEPAPMPKAKPQTKVELRFDLTPRGAAIGVGVGSTKPATAVPPVATTASFEKVPAHVRLHGTWCRETAGFVMAFTFANEELTMTLKSNDGEISGTASLTADYSVTKDGTVHGVFTSADVDVKGDAQAQMELATMFQAMVDQPFAFRCKCTEGGLIVSHVRLPDPKGDMKESMAMLCGKYTFAEKGSIPNPKSATASAPNWSDRSDIVLPLPGGPVAFPAAFLECPAGACPPRVVSGSPAAACPAPQFGFVAAPPPQFAVPSALAGPPQAGGPPPEVHAMMMQTFGQMMGAPGFCPPQMPYPAAQVAWTAAAPASIRPAATLPTGTWTREIGPVTYKLEFKDGHLTATMSTLQSDEGKPVRVDHVLTADCYQTRNPGELVGIVTSFDISASGSTVSVDDVFDLLKTLPTIQKQMTGKPLVLTFRVIEDALVIGGVRLPVERGERESAEMLETFAALGGKYRTTSLTPKPLPVRTVSDTTQPNPHFLVEYPQACPLKPTPPFGSRPAPAGPECERIGVDFNYNPPRRTGYPPMPQPAPLPESGTRTNPFRNGGK